MKSIKETAEKIAADWPNYASPVDAIEQILYAERERCAKIAENYQTGFVYPSNDAGLIAAARMNIAADIRRSEYESEPSQQRSKGTMQVQKPLKSGTMRRSRVDLLTPAEAAIRIAQIAVEEMAAHPALTDAASHLQQARDKVADYVDEEMGQLVEP